MAEPKFSKQTVTNVTGGPKIINSRNAVLLQGGETAEVDINEGELAAAKETGWFEFGAAAAKRAADAKDEGDTGAAGA